MEVISRISDKLIGRLRQPHWGRRWLSLGTGRWLWRLIITSLSSLPFLGTWYNPFWLHFSAIFIILLLLAVWWHQWEGWSRLASWLAGGVVLLFFWGSLFLVWLFSENTEYEYRTALLLLLLFFSWWYLREWQRLRLTLFLGETGAGAVPTLVLGFISSLAFGIAAENFLVFLNTPLWLITLAFYLPVAILVVCFTYTSGWSLLKKWTYWFTGLAVTWQAFLLATWWPTSFYVVGFVVAAVFALTALVLRQEAQGFISRRSFSRELSLVLGALLIVILTARWH